MSLLLAHLLLSLPALADPGSLEHHTLENGLDVILSPDPRATSVHVNLWYHVGAADESPGLTGFAHLFEHLMFQGSPSAPGEYFAPLEAVGASVNGTTSVDRTNYFQTVPPEYLPLALFLESDRMGGLLELLDQERLDNQREVVRNERRQRYEDPPYGTAWAELMMLLYPPTHPYHHLPIGSHEDLMRATLDEVRGFFQTWYGPDNASLVITGNFDPEQALDLTQTYFGGIEPRGPTPRTDAPTPPDPTLRRTLERHVAQDVPRPRLYMAWHTPAAFQPGDAEAILLADVLSGGRESRLDQALVHEQALATSVTAFNRSNRLGSTLVIVATPNEGTTTAALAQRIQEEVADLWGSRPPTEAELITAQATVEHRLFSALPPLSQRADQLNRYQMYLGTPSGLSADLQRFADLSVEDLSRAAERWLGRPRAELHIQPHAPPITSPWTSLRTDPLPVRTLDPEEASP